jgi:hypothetical protein
MNTEPNYLNALEVLAEYGSNESLSNDECADHESVMSALGALDDDEYPCCYIDYYIDMCLTEFYDPQQDDEKPDYEEWQEYCHGKNRDLVDAVLDKYGITEGWGIHVPEDTEIIVRKPAFEHCTGHVRVYPAGRHDEEEAEEDHDNDYTKTTVFDAVQDAAKEIIAIDRKGAGNRTPTDLWRRRLAVKVLQEMESL